MARSAAEKTIRELQRRLAKEEKAHADTRRILQTENMRIWRLVPSHYINLMGVYPPLRKLLHVLAEAADLQDPSRGAPIEDTMSVQFVHVGANASTSHTEASVHSFDKARAHTRILREEMTWLVNDFIKRLDDKTRTVARLISSDEWEYDIPDKPVCWRKTTDKDGNVIWECPMRGRKQSYTAWHTGCGGCGRVFELEETG